MSKQEWVHTYRDTEIANGGTITAQTPGRRIAHAISEIQLRAVTQVESEVDGIEIEIDGNTLLITGEGLPSGITDQVTVLTGAPELSAGKLRFPTTVFNVINGLISSIESTGEYTIATASLY